MLKQNLTIIEEQMINSLLGTFQKFFKTRHYKAMRLREELEKTPEEILAQVAIAKYINGVLQPQLHSSVQANLGVPVVWPFLSQQLWGMYF